MVFYVSPSDIESLKVSRNFLSILSVLVDFRSVVNWMLIMSIHNFILTSLFFNDSWGLFQWSRLWLSLSYSTDFSILCRGSGICLAFLPSFLFTPGFAGTAKSTIWRSFFKIKMKSMVILLLERVFFFFWLSQGLVVLAEIRCSACISKSQGSVLVV